MSQILSPSGKLLEIQEAVPVCERLVRFNGAKRLLMETAKNVEEANAIAMSVATSPMEAFSNRELVVGNLPTQKVSEILHALLTEGYFDFSSFDYQKARQYEEMVFDQGKSSPYSTETVMLPLMGPFCNRHGMMPLQPFTINQPADESGDYDEDGFEEEGLDE